MKKRKQIMKRMGALVCALVVAVSCFCLPFDVLASVDYLGSGIYKYTEQDYCNYYFTHDYSVRFFKECYLESDDLSGLPGNPYNYPYCLVSYFNGYYWCFYTSEPLKIGGSSTNVTEYSNDNDFVIWSALSISPNMEYTAYFCNSGIVDDFNSLSWKSYTVSSSGSNAFLGSCSISSDGFYESGEGNLIYTNYDICCSYCGDVYLFAYGGDASKPIYNGALGYLQNVTRKSTYVRDAFYNYDEDSLTYHWYHDLQSTSGIDLSSGNYVIRHYVSNATVTGYEKEDIVEMSEKFHMADYDASKGYFSYLQKDYMDKLYALGYEDLGFFDTVFNGYFTLQHHYFQIVNTSTNEVGGYLHFYPKDADSDKFGVELVYDGLDNNFDVDPDGPSGNIGTPSGSGENMDDALENADKPKLDDLSGVTEFITVLEAYGDEVSNVSNAFGALLNEFPPWVLGVLGISFVLLVIGALFGIMKG